MPKKFNPQRLASFLILVFILQACTCYGFDITAWLTRGGGGTSNSNESQSETVSSLNCSNVRLTSPRGGLPNGVATIYWDALAGAVNYRINLYSGAVRIGTWEAAAPATSLQADVSQGAVGGQNPFELELLAFDANGNYCRDYVTQDREAAPPQPAPVVAPPTPTPTCAEKPDRPICG